MDYYKVFLDVVDGIIKNEDVNSILLIGKASSVDESKFNDLNDIDILVIYNKNVDFERQVEKINDVPFDISFISIFDLITQIEAKSSLWINMIMTSKIYYSKDELIFGIIDRVKDIYLLGQKNLKENDIDLIRFKLTQKYIEINNRIEDVILSAYLMNKLLDRILKDYYKINDRWYPNNKYIFDNLEIVDRTLCDLSKEFIFECIIKRKIILLKEILDYVLNPFGGLLFTWSKGPYKITL